MCEKSLLSPLPELAEKSCCLGDPNDPPAALGQAFIIAEMGAHTNPDGAMRHKAGTPVGVNEPLEGLFCSGYISPFP